MVDTVPQALKIKLAHNISKWKKKFIYCQWVSTNPTVAESSFLAKKTGLSMRSQLTFVPLFFHTIWAFLSLHGFDLKCCVMFSYSPFYSMPVPSK